MPRRGRHAEVRALLIANHRSLEDSAAKRDDEKLLAEVALNGSTSTWEQDRLLPGELMWPVVSIPSPDSAPSRLTACPLKSGRGVLPVPFASATALALRRSGNPRPPSGSLDSSSWPPAIIWKVHRLDLAGRTADRMLALARLVVERNSKQPICGTLSLPTPTTS